MATYTGATIYDILINNRVTNNGSSPLDTTHTFTTTTSGNINHTVEVLNFYGNQTVTSGNVNSFFNDVTANQHTITCVRIFHGNLTIDSNVNFTPPFVTRGLVVFVKGSVTLGSGSRISMTERGSNDTSVNVHLFSGATVPATGQTGATSVTQTGSTNNRVSGNTPATSLPSRGTGGGGSGSVETAGGGTGTKTATSGTGGTGTAFSGGGGSGGALAAVADTQTRTATSANATVNGTIPVITTNTNLNATLDLFFGGGAGIVGGLGRKVLANSQTQSAESSSSVYSGASGAGGLLVVYCLNSVSGAGTFESNGSQGGSRGSTSNVRVGGGGSGGGSVNVFTRTGTPNMTATGGAGGATLNTIAGGAGGNGSTTSSAMAGNTLPRRHLFFANNLHWYRDFEAGTWASTNLGEEDALNTFGMFDAELYAIDRSQISGISGINMSAVTIKTMVAS